MRLRGPAYLADVAIAQGRPWGRPFCVEKRHGRVNSSADSPSSRPGWRSSGGTFDLENRSKRLLELEERMAAPGFWDRPRPGSGGPFKRPID